MSHCSEEIRKHFKRVLETYKHHHHQHSFLELEMRLGTAEPNNDDCSFAASTDKNFVMFVLHLFSTCTEWSLVEEWREIHDYFLFDADQQQQRRRSIIFDFETNSVKQESIAKKRLCDMVIRNPHFYYDFRLSLSMESPVSGETSSNPNAAAVVVEECRHVRIKQRKTFYYTSKGSHTPTWKFDVTLSWSGRTKQEAEMRQIHGDPCYEFEIECVGIANYLLQLPENEELILDSFLEKVFDVLFFYHCENNKTTTTAARSTLRDQFVSSLH